MLNIEESKEDHIAIYQDASVYIPVEVTSSADSGEIKTSRLGDPTVAFHEDRRNGKYRFTIMQPICVEIPIEISAEALLGKLYIKCGDETETGREPDREKTETGREPVFEEIGEVSSPEPEQLSPSQNSKASLSPSPKPSPYKNLYKVYF